MPQPRVLNLNEPNKWKGLTDLVGGTANQYMESRAENKFNTALEALGPDASEDDVMNAIRQTQGVAPQRKQSRLKQYQDVMQDKAKIRSMDADAEYKKAAARKMDFDSHITAIDRTYGKEIDSLRKYIQQVNEDPLLDAEQKSRLTEPALEQLEKNQKQVQKILKKMDPDFDVDEVGEVEEAEQFIQQQPQQIAPSRRPQYSPEQIDSMKQAALSQDAPLADLDKINAASGLMPYQVRRQSMIDKYGRDPGPSQAEKRAQKEHDKAVEKADKFIQSINEGRFPESARRAFEMILKIPGMDEGMALQMLEEKIDIPGVSQEEMTEYYLDALNEGADEMGAMFEMIDRATQQLKKIRSKERDERARNYSKRS